MYEVNQLTLLVDNFAWFSPRLGVNFTKLIFQSSCVRYMYIFGKCLWKMFVSKKFLIEGPALLL